MLLPPPQFPYELIEPVTAEYIAISPYWKVMAVSTNVWRFLTGHPALLKTNVDVREYLPELVGIESAIQDVINGAKERITIAGIYRDSPIRETPGFYFNLNIQLRSWKGLNPRQLVVEIEDVTPRMQLEQRFVQYSNETALIYRQLSASQDYTQKIIDAILDGVIVTDNVGQIKTTNPAVENILGFSQTALETKNINDILRDYNILQQLRQSALKLANGGMGKSPLIEAPCYDQQGQMIEIECSCTLIRSKVEKFQGFVYTFRNIRDRKATQTQLQQKTAALQQATQASEKAKQIKSDFVAMVSHEIRTPINAILGITELMSDTNLDTEQNDFVQTIRSSSETLLHLINDILDFSKLEAGHLETTATPFNLRDSITEVTNIFKHTAAKKQIRLLSNIHPNVPPIIQSDRRRINQILINLLGNAIKFTHSGFVSLDISAQHIGDPQHPQYRVAFAVTDTGIGIEPDRLEQLFQDFQQADQSIHQRYGGTRLGLSISKRLSELLGGSIQVNSQLDRGSKFTLTITTTAA